MFSSRDSLTVCKQYALKGRVNLFYIKYLLLNRILNIFLRDLMITSRDFYLNRVEFHKYFSYQLRSICIQVNSKLYFSAVNVYNTRRVK